MSLVRIAKSDLPIDRLLSLTSNFEPDEFKRICQSFLTFNCEDDDLWSFNVGEEATLLVALAYETTDKKSNGRSELHILGVSAAILSACWWENWLRSEHPSEESYSAERKEFDQEYDQLLQHTRSIIGDPEQSGQDQDQFGFRHAIWRGEQGLLILQQSAYDVQFGCDINFWVRPWVGPIPHVDGPFINWLTAEEE